DQQTKILRQKKMSAAANEVRTEILKSLINTTDTCLLEMPNENGDFTGYTTTYVPCLVNAPQHKKGDIVKVQLGEFIDGKNIAKLVE
ncbi:MAG: tRNA (N(6)-L-threonylcarbamoyladenosine(37)-C(2))-methylthiotransferase MtaB, partial [Oscillospiraceae bacterium]